MGLVCISPPPPITLELAKEAMWWVGFSLFFLPLLTSFSYPGPSPLHHPLPATDSFYVVLFLSENHMPVF